MIASTLATTAALLAVLAVPEAPAHADSVPPKPFYADSTSPLDGCPLGYTKGTLFWRTPGPLPRSRPWSTEWLGDRPETNGAKDCADDGYSSTVIFAAYNGGVVVDSAAVTVENGVQEVASTLGANSTATRPTHVVIQVCRDPVLTLPPSYCGAASRTGHSDLHSPGCRTADRGVPRHGGR